MPDTSAAPERSQRAMPDAPLRSQRDPLRTLSTTTRTCNAVADVYMWTGGVVMGLDRGVLARIDRRLLAGLGQDETYRMVRVPATAAMWSTWKRYCDAAGLSMGHAIAILIGHELAGVLDDTDPEDSAVLPARAGEELVRRQADVTRREQEAEAVEDRLRVWNEELRRRER